MKWRADRIWRDFPRAPSPFREYHPVTECEERGGVLVNGGATRITILCRFSFNCRRRWRGKIHGKRLYICVIFFFFYSRRPFGRLSDKSPRGMGTSGPFRIGLRQRFSHDSPTKLQITCTHRGRGMFTWRVPVSKSYLSARWRHLDAQVGSGRWTVSPSVIVSRKGGNGGAGWGVVRLNRLYNVTTYFWYRDNYLGRFGGGNTSRFLWIATPYLALVIFNVD